MANKLLEERGCQLVSKNWVDRFIKCTPELKTKWTCLYNYQQAACKDLAVISFWFILVQLIKDKYNIQNKNTYNFDKFGFIMGKITLQFVVTGSEKPNKWKKIQPSNWEWVILI